KVRFAGRDRPGYLVERVEEPEHSGKLAALRTVVSEEPVLTPAVLELARRIAGEQAGTVMDVLRLAIPPRHARAEKALPADPPEEGPPPSPARVPSVWSGYRAGAAWWSRVAKGESPRAAWLAAPSRPPEEDWPRALAEAGRAALASGRGSVLVVPDQRDVARVDAELTRVLGAGRHVSLTAGQGPQARYTAWLKVLR